MTNESIRRELADLDEQFASPENCKTGRIKLAEYTKRHSELLKRLRETEQEDQDARRVAQVQQSAPRQRYVMPRDDARKLKEMARVLKAAVEAGNDNAALEILQSEDYLRLLYLDELQDAGELSGNAYAAAIGARVTLAMKYIAVAGLRRRAVEARIAALETAIPRYVGVHRTGSAYEQSQIVTHGGSMWIALRDTATKPPGADWQMCVRGVRS